MAPFFMDGVQLPQGLSHFEEAVYFPQKFLVFTLSTSEGWKTKSGLDLRALEPPSASTTRPLLHKPFSFSRYSTVRISIFPIFSPCQPLL